MYRKERLINSTWYYKTTPTGEWRPMNKAQLSRKAEDLWYELENAKNEIAIINLKLTL